MIDLITPESATTTHYFWAFARNFRLDETAFTEFLRANVRRTLTRTRRCSKGSNGIWPETEPTFQLTIKADAGPTQGRRLFASMIEAETRGSA